MEGLFDQMLGLNHPCMCQRPGLEAPVFSLIPICRLSFCFVQSWGLACTMSTSRPAFLTLLSLFNPYSKQGSNATGDCCSKCWNGLRKETPTCSPAVAAPQPAEEQPEVSKEPEVAPTPEPMAVAKPAAVEPIKKKKKKKASYKNMLAGMMEGSGERDAEKEKEAIARVTGGGQFSKIDKI